MNTVEFTGQQIGPYLVRELIGRGGMGNVYRAFQPSVKREVALKIIQLTSSPESDEFRQRFEHEAETIASLEHPHILPVFDYGITQNVAYLAMRLVPGGTLEDLLDRGPIPLDLVGDLFGQFARALDYAHRRGVIHRDLKPSNVLIDAEYHAYLSDFGLAKMLHGTSHPSLTVPGLLVGTPAYMAPEQFQGARIDHHADIYSLGTILYYMLTRRPLFEGDSPLSLIYQHLEKTPTPPRSINPEIPPAVEAVVLRALAKDPRKRFHSAEQMALALDHALGRTTTPTRVGGPSSKTVRLVRLKGNPFARLAAEIRFRSRRVFLALATLVILVLVIAALIWVKPAIAPEFHPPTVFPGQRAPADSITITNDEVALAAQHLGDEGFIAYIACNQRTAFFAAHAREMNDLARQRNLDFRVYDSDNDAYQQIVQIERARTDGAGALIVCVLDPDLLSETLAAVQEAGIPLVLNNVSGPPSYGGVVVAVDNYQLGLEPGRLAGKIVAEEMGGEADVVILDYPSLPIIVERADGMEAGLLEYAPNAHIVGRFLGGTAENGATSIHNLIVQGVAFNVILSINDAGTYGAISALEAAQIPPDAVIIVSVDAESMARQLIRNGHYLRGSVEVTGMESGARPSIYAAIKLLAGGSLAETLLVPPGKVITREALTDAD